MSEMLKKFSDIQKKAILGKLDVMKDANDFDKSLKNISDDNPFLKQAVNQVAMEKLAEMLATDMENQKKEKQEFINKRAAVNEEIFAKLAAKYMDKQPEKTDGPKNKPEKEIPNKEEPKPLMAENKTDIPSTVEPIKEKKVPVKQEVQPEQAAQPNDIDMLTQILSQAFGQPTPPTELTPEQELFVLLNRLGNRTQAPKYQRFASGEEFVKELVKEAGSMDKIKALYRKVISSGADDALLEKFDDIIGATSKSKGGLASKLTPNKGVVDKTLEAGKTPEAIYDKLRSIFSQGVEKGVTKGQFDDAGVNKLLGNMRASAGSPLDPSVFEGLDAKALNEILKNVQTRNKLIGGAGLGAAGLIGAPIAATTLGAGPSGIANILSEFGDVGKPLEELADQFPNLGGDLKDYAAGAGSGALTGLLASYLAQGAGTGNWNPLEMDPAKAALATGTGAATGAVTAPLFPSIFPEKK